MGMMSGHQPMSPIRAILASVLATATLAPVCRAEESTGHATLTFSERSELGSAKSIESRMGWSFPEDKTEEVAYKIADESFEVYVPKDYTGEKPYGLFVFVSPSGNGNPPRHWLASMDEHHLIWVGPNKAGNDRYAHLRMG